MTQKIPPPPPLAVELQALNRWLLEIQSILNASGDIDPGSVAGLPALVTQVAALAVTVTALQVQTNANTNNIATNTSNITANTNSITALALRVTALEARNQVLNGAGVPAVGLGNNGDLYINNTGGAGTNLYAKRGGAWVAFA